MFAQYQSSSSLDERPTPLRHFVNNLLFSKTEIKRRGVNVLENCSTFNAGYTA